MYHIQGVKWVVFVSQEWIYAKWQIGLVSNIYRCCQAHRSGSACVHSVATHDSLRLRSLSEAIKPWPRGSSNQALAKRVKQSSLGKRVKQSSLGQEGQAIKSWQRESNNQVLAERVESNKRSLGVKLLLSVSWERAIKDPSASRFGRAIKRVLAASNWPSAQDMRP